ncbi:MULTISPECIES: phosphoribulokinase [Methanothrix]|jgi:phosphoribulokinase|uniref:phosphoribulokinase n=3 Tax=root TaxID=1 RepID=F4BW53_METSG|nr:MULTISPECIES: phosphoribulokinase [Methanothrix]NYT08741.1 phosphoribulokinase [Methanosarcinales archaeon]AEB68483.1 phosphoribulokinase/uridine kinase family [Methanothrix soehngenii GP6]MBP7068367.1 phosphoribulokinase [Methanothrix sp.]MDD3551243.1 phosphoribulokinase [Methanothrix soehngenii]MDY0411577.1 phosphoribulokinase [Methanothrix soehngenii]
MRSLKDRIRESGRVFVFGIAGDSGSGKTTISRGIRRILGEDMVATFSMDDYHSLDRRQRKERNITPLHPDANQFDLLAEHLEALRRNERIDKPVYDHRTGEISGTVPFGPAPVIIVEGLHPLYTERLRSQIDFKIFVDPSRSVKRLWKIRRDVGERGYETGQVMAEILQREPDYKLYVDIQKIYAQIVIKIQDSRFHPSLLDSQSTLDWYSVRLIMEIMEHPVSEVSMNIDLSKILRRSEHEFSIEFQRDDYYGKRVGIMTMDGEIHQSMISDLEKKLGESLGTDGMISDRREEYVNAIGLAQLILTWNCVEKLDYLLQEEGY